jgi:hypothetical protein
MSEFRVKVPITVTVPVRSPAKTKGDAVDVAVAAIHGYLPWLDLKIDKDAIVIDELKDGTPLAKELFINAEFTN